MKKRLIAYHLTQFHQIPENDLWWGEGYTEWTAIRKWQPYFKNHILRKPERLGYYNLLDPETLENQFEIASKHNIEGFCFWTYWFGAGERLLEKPLEHLLSSKSSVKYCLAWANHSWMDKSKWKLLKEQKYLGENDYKMFFEAMLPHFKNKNYIKYNNKPILSIFMPQEIPDFDVFYSTWNRLIQKEGFDGFYFITDQISDTLKFPHLFDAFMQSGSFFANRTLWQKILDRLIRIYSWTFLGPMRYSYPQLAKKMYLNSPKNNNFIPTIFTGWDSTPRHGKRGIVLENFTPESFKEHVQEVFDLNTKNEFIFIKSWNEWAEGNLIEPDDIFGDSLLKVIRDINTN